MIGLRFYRNVPILTFHKIDPCFEWGAARMAPHHFYRIIKFLLQDGFETINIDQLLDTDTVLPPKPIILTFDDGYENIYKYAFPLMENSGFKGVVFIISDFIGKLNTWDYKSARKRFRHLSEQQICELSCRGWDIGSHAVNHKALTSLDNNTLYEELLESRKLLEKICCKPVKTIAYPFGIYNQHIINTAQNAGYEKSFGFIVSKKLLSEDHPFVLPRRGVYLFENNWHIHHKINSTVFSGFEDIKLKWINSFARGTVLLQSIKKQ